MAHDDEFMAASEKRFWSRILVLVVVGFVNIKVNADLVGVKVGFRERDGSVVQR